MNDSTTRKTLSLKKKAAPVRTGTDEEPRKRSGARARQAALREHARQTRPETETVVQAGIDWLTRERLSTPRIVDLCAGSGAIGLSLVTEVRGAQVWAVEKVPRTYDWTMRNWRRISRLDPLAADNYHLELGDATSGTTLAQFDGTIDMVAPVVVPPISTSTLSSSISRLAKPLALLASLPSS